MTILLYAIWSLLFQKVPIKGPGQRHKYASVSNSYKSNPRSRSIKTGVLKIFAKSKGKHLSQSFFLIKLQVSTLLKKKHWLFSCEFSEISINIRKVPAYVTMFVQNKLLKVFCKKSISIQCDSVLLLVYIPM